MKRILFVTTQYRVGERIYPIIPKLGAIADLDILKLYQMDPATEWDGDVDLRLEFDKKYGKYFDNTYACQHAAGIKIDYTKYDLIITDDNRQYNGLTHIYTNRSCILLACCHGVTDHGYENHGVGKSFDGCFVFGEKEVTQEYHLPSGIPANDKLSEYKDIDKEHILVIVNYLGNAGTISTGVSGIKKPSTEGLIAFDSWGHYGSHHTVFKLFDKEVFDAMDLLELQKQYNKPIVIKMKARPTTNIKSDVDYLASILPEGLDYNVLFDVENDNKLIAQSEVVISAPSTLALKSLQLQIPTALLFGTGQTGLFHDYNGLVPLGKENIKTVLNQKPDVAFINKTITGGIKFNSTDYFINYIMQCMEQYNG